MIEIEEERFNELVTAGIDAIPSLYQNHLTNVAFIVEGDPSLEQRLSLKLFPHETLFGLYEGVPLPFRSGGDKLLPDKITLFKNPMLAASKNEEELKKMINHTIWHEVAHYYGLDHDRIHELERKHYRP